MISLEKVSRFLILAFPVLIISVKILGPLIYVLLALIGIYWMIEKRVSPFSIPELKLFSWITFGYFLVMVFSVVLSSEPENDWVHLSRKAQFLIAPLVGLTIYYSSVNIEKVIKYVRAVTLLLSILVILQYVFDVSFMRFGNRYSGMFNPNTFGDILIIMIFISTIYLSKETIREYLFTLSIVSLGAMAIVFTGSRASMLGYVGLMGISVFLHLLKYSYNKRRVFFIAILGLAFMIFSLSVSSDGTKRIGLVESQIIQWENGKALTSSIGARLEMYKSGMLAFVDSPWIGYGYRNSNVVASRYARQKAKKYIASMSHLHNEYLTNMVSAGIFGLIALLLLFGLPLKQYIQNFKDDDKQEVIFVGIFLVIGYMLLGMTHGMLDYEYENSFFIFFLAWSMSKT